MNEGEEGKDLIFLFVQVHGRVSRGRSNLGAK